MSLIDDVQSALKEGRVIIGYKRSLEFIKNNSPKRVVITENIPNEERKEIEYNANLSDVKVDIFEGSSRDLGVICGKPFPIMALVIKD